MHFPFKILLPKRRVIKFSYNSSSKVFGKQTIFIVHTHKRHISTAILLPPLINCLSPFSARSIMKCSNLKIHLVHERPYTF